MLLDSFYYTNSKKIFSNKIDALEHQLESNEKIFFYYHDHVYDKLDWTVEPPYTLEYYYRTQAQRIRDEYDYVVLFYSGGYDSTNILETFYFNNIKIDKIVCVGAFGQDESSGSDKNHNGELYHNSFPYLKELGLESIVQVCDYSDYFNDVKNFSVYSLGNEWVKHIGPWYSPHNWFWRDIHHYVVPENMKDKKVALIWGKDKPPVFEHDGKYYFRFFDTPALSYAGEVKYNNISRINFYWDPQFPLIPVKQAHTLIDRTGKVDLSNQNIVYNLKKPLQFKSGKSNNNFLSLRDSFLLNKQSSDIFRFYSDGIKYVDSKNIKLRSVVAISSRHYFIRNVNDY